MLPIVFNEPAPRPDTPDQRAKDDLKARIMDAYRAGDWNLAAQLQEELVELRTEFYRRQMAGEVS